MGLLRRTAKPPLDAPIGQHLDAILRARDEQPLHRTVHALAARPLFLALRELPPGVRPGEVWTATGAEHLQMATTTLPNGTGTALLVFTSQDEVHARNPAAFPAGMPGRQVLDKVVADFDGLVLDPASRPQPLMSVWIRDALAVEPTP